MNLFRKNIEQKTREVEGVSQWSNCLIISNLLMVVGYKALEPSTEHLNNFSVFVYQYLYVFLFSFTLLLIAAKYSP